jgi:hypothetical protein
VSYIEYFHGLQSGMPLGYAQEDIVYPFNNYLSNMKIELLPGRLCGLIQVELQEKLTRAIR